MKQSPKPAPLYAMTLTPWPEHSGTFCVTAAEGTHGLNGTLPRRVTHTGPRARKYAHFDDPLDQDDLDSIVVSSAEVARHAFLPLLGYQKRSRKIDFSVFPPIIKDKERDIRYASHKDAAIFSIYSRLISPQYEQYLNSIGTSDAVLAYRSGIGYNVPFAKALFDEIKSKGSCTVICLDISGFFDNLNHEYLKNRICDILSVERLPDDWFAIFKRLTRFDFVLREDAERVVGKPKSNRICTIDQFRSKIRPIINTNPNVYGIPQGTSLSGMFANIYMSRFDAEMVNLLNSMGGSYRRYSDDIAIVIPADTDELTLIESATRSLCDIGLQINEKKTCITKFHTTGGSLHYNGDQLQYLGFTFDGSRILIRPESIKNFYAKMKANVRRYIKSATRNKIPSSALRKRVLIGRFTHWGDNRNFIQYAYRAARELESPEIKRQLRKHVPMFNDHWARMVAKHGL